MIQYKRIIIEGFGACCKPVEFPLDRVGINLVKGINGQGKSTVFDALIWAEYGHSSRDTLASWEEVRTKSYRGTRVMLDRSDSTHDYRIVRHSDFVGDTCGLIGGNRLMIFKKEKGEDDFTKFDLVGTSLHKKDMQELINTQLGAEYKAFVKSIIMPQKSGGLMEMDNKSKREMFDKLFDLGFIEDAKAEGKKRIEALKEAIYKRDSQMQLAKATIENVDALKEQQERSKAAFAANKEGRRNTLLAAQHAANVSLKRVLEAEQSAKQLVLTQKGKYLEKGIETEVDAWIEATRESLQNSSKLVEYKATIAERETLRASNAEKEAEKTRTLAAFKRESNELESQIAKLTKDLKEVATNCPYCMQDLDISEVAKVKTSITDKLHTTKKLLLDNIDKCNRYLEGVEPPKDLTFLQEKIDKLKAEVLGERDLYNEVVALRKEEVQLQNQLEKSSVLIPSSKKAVEDLSNQLIDLEAESLPLYDLTEKEGEKRRAEGQLSTYTKEQEHDNKKLEQLEWWMKKGLSSSGMRAYVFNAMLNKLNTYVRKYADRLGLGVVFSVDLTKKTTPFVTTVYKGKLEKPYNDFSGGQKQRIGLCLWFAMHDLISEKVGSNIFVMDEGFEGLDNEGTEAAFDLLRVKAENKSVYVITHSDMIDGLNCRHIFITADLEGSTVVKS